MPFKDECGVFGVCDSEDAANLAYLGLYALQHRGQESAGIAALDDAGAIHVEREMGYVADVFDETRLSRLPSRSSSRRAAGPSASRTTATSSTRARSGPRSSRRAPSSRRRRTRRSSST